MSAGYVLAASILSADFAALGDAIREAESAGADWIHIDVMDGHFVPNVTMGPVVVEACRRTTSLPLDVHLMVENPDGLFGPFLDAGADSLTVHIEACPNVHRSLQTLHELGGHAGVAINPGTPAMAVSELLGVADLILVMTVNPGYAGQSFLESCLPKVREVRRLLTGAGSAARLQVDGGISAATAPSAARAGADTFVAASAIFKHPEGIRAGVSALRQALESAAADPAP